MRKVSLHFQTTTYWARDVFTRYWQWPRYVKQIFYSPDEPDLFPYQRTIARVWIGGDAEEMNYVHDHDRGAVAYFKRCKPFYEGLRGKVWAFEGPNEPDVSTSHARRNLALFSAKLRSLLAEIGYPYVAGSFSNGNPDVTNDEAMRDLESLWRACPLIGIHEYGCPTMFSGMVNGQVVNEPQWWTLRHELIYAWCEKNLGVRPRFMITETGIDGTGTPYGRKGWRSIIGNFEEYKRQLVEYDMLLVQDSSVAAAFVFTAGATDQWRDFDIGEAEARALGGASVNRGGWYG